MAITRWFETAEQENKSLTTAELQHEHQLIIDLAKHANLSAKGFDADVYDHLLPAMKLAFQHELHGNTLEEQLSYARLSAFKLTILFGNIDKSVAYLKRFEEANPGTRQHIHDACLFSLPSGNQWNNTLWRKIIGHFNVTAPENPILRLFPLAEKIEIYIKDHAKEIIGVMVEDITQYYEHLFSNEWDEEQKKQVTTSPNLKAIQNKVNQLFEAELRSSLHLPASGKLTSEQTNILAKEKEKQTHRRQEIEIAVTDQWQEKLEKLIQEKNANPAHAKQMKIASRLKKLVDSNTIQKEAAKRYEHLLTPSKVDINWLNKYVASKLYYLRAQENIQAAALFSAQGLSEDVFNEYLALTPVDNPVHIPDIHIDGKEISDAYQGYYLKKLSPFNPEAAYLGKETSCCQSLDHASGKEPTIYGITSEYAGFYALYKKARTALEKDIVVAQSLAWRNGIMMLDSEESQMDVKKHYEIMLADFAVMLAHRLVKMGAVPAVYIGHGNTPSMLTEIKALAFVNPVDYEGYRDSRVQYVVADKHLPFVLYYALRNKNSALASHPNDFLPEIPLTNEQIDRFCEALFTEGDAVNIIFSVYPEIKDEMLSHRNKILALNMFLQTPDPEGISLETFKLFFISDNINPNVQLDKQKNTPLSLLIGSPLKEENA